MSEINLPPFYIGQRVVRTVSSRKLKKGSEYIVEEIKYCCVKWGWRIGLMGVDNDLNGSCECLRRDVPPFAAKNFAPIEENFEMISYKEVIRKEKPLTCSN